MSQGGQAVAFILKGYPRLSETFIAQEVRGLERAGLDIRIVSLRLPTDSAVHPVHGEIKAPVSYLPEYLLREPLRVLRAARHAWHSPRLNNTLRIWWRDFRRDSSANRVRRLGQAFVLASELPAEVRHLHAHFLHTPASVARYTSLLTGLPWTCSAHAKDIWTSPAWEKREKLADCHWAVTCTAANREHLQALCAVGGRVELIYHGLDLDRFSAPRGARPARDGSAADDPVVVLSVGRAVEKKGYEDVLDAFAALPPALQWRFVHVGAGPLRKRLVRRALSLGLTSRVSWLGAQPLQRVLEQYRCADLFVLASRVARDGDRDGLPNVLMEAQSQHLACIATRVSGIPELVEDGRTGVLVGERDTSALACAIERLIRDPDLRERLGRAAGEHVRGHFCARAGIERLARKFARASHSDAQCRGRVVHQQAS